MRIRRTKEQWQTLLEEQKESGKTVTGFCKDLGIHQNMFYRKKKELCSNGSFVKVPIGPARPQAIKIKIGNATIEAEAGFNEKDIQAIIRILLEALNA